MNTKERIFHMVLFEMLAIVILIILAVIFTGNAPSKMGGLALLLSLVAMVWNYIYNIIFDKLFGENRIDRSFLIRLLHGGLFEFGMIIFSFPVMMWVLKLSLFKVFMMDLAVVIFFFLYAVVFNWVYDNVKNSLLKS